VVRAQRRLTDLHREPELGAGTGQVTQVLQHAAEVASKDADDGVGWSGQRRLTDLTRSGSPRCS